LRVNFVEADTYKFSLRRWPEESRATLGAALFDAESGMPYTSIRINGKALAYQTAFLRIGGTLHQVAVDLGKEAAEFELNIPAGQTELTAYFELEDSTKSQAYYIVVDNNLSATTLYNNCDFGGNRISLGEGEYPDMLSE